VTHCLKIQNTLNVFTRLNRMTYIKQTYRYDNVNSRAIIIVIYVLSDEYIDTSLNNTSDAEIYEY